MDVLSSVRHSIHNNTASISYRPKIQYDTIQWCGQNHNSHKKRPQYQNLTSGFDLNITIVCGMILHQNTILSPTLTIIGGVIKSF